VSTLSDPRRRTQSGSQGGAEALWTATGGPPRSWTPTRTSSRRALRPILSPGAAFCGTFVMGGASTNRAAAPGRTGQDNFYNPPC
jgi:hypothetical protein